MRNRFLFTQRFYEQGDAAANSIRIQQAMHVTLLVGNYSREGFSHPGPAYMYAQAFGQWIFLSGLHVVPTAWNAHLLAVFVLNSALLALAVLIVYGWTRSVRGAAACLAVIGVFGAVHPPAINSDWMPYLYVVMFCVFLIAAASVAAGHVRDAWIAALTGWFLIHGHACFLFIVPVLTATAAAVLRLGAPAHAGRLAAAVPAPRARRVDRGAGHQRAVRAADRGQPGPALAR